MDSLSVYQVGELFELHYTNAAFERKLKTMAKSPGYKHSIRFGKPVKVKATVLPNVASAAKAFFQTINVTTLSPQYARFFDKKGPKPGVTTANSGKNPHASLFLLPNAPAEVIKAAYRALSLLYHPDQGGDVDRFREINDAYKQLTKP